MNRLKDNGVHVDNRIYLVINNEIMVFSRKYMDLDIIMLDSDKYFSYGKC